MRRRPFDLLFERLKNIMRKLALPDEIFMQVEKPARYIGNEINAVMKDKNIDSLEDLIKTAQDNGVELIACSMSMDVMGIKNEELIDGVKLSGVATMLANGEESDMSLFI